RGRVVDGGLALQRAEAGLKDALLVQRGDRDQVVLLAQLEVLLAAPRGDVDDARALLLADLVPGDYAVDCLRRLVRGPALPDRGVRGFRRVATGVGLRGQLVERPVVRPTEHFLAG